MFMTLFRQERQRRIAELLQEGESLRVEALSEDLGVSKMTIRRDLVEMEGAGLLVRVRGGAMRKVPRLAFEQRADRNAFAKGQIAAACAGMVNEEETLILDTGTTTSYVARELCQFANLTVITNSINAALELHQHSQNKVLLTGGLMYGESELSLIGHMTATALKSLSVDKAILGCGGITLGRGLTYYDTQEVQARQLMLECARELVVVADSTKFGQERLISLAPLERADTIVTDSVPARPFPQQLDNRDVRLVVAREYLASQEQKTSTAQGKGA